MIKIVRERVLTREFLSDVSPLKTLNKYLEPYQIWMEEGRVYSLLTGKMCGKYNLDLRGEQAFIATKKIDANTFNKLKSGVKDSGLNMLVVYEINEN